MRPAISITLSGDNALWLKAQATATARGNVSAVVNRLVHEARLGGKADLALRRSVVGTIDIPIDDALDDADLYVRALFDRSLARPMLVKERPDPPAVKKPRRKRAGR